MESRHRTSHSRRRPRPVVPVPSYNKDKGNDKKVVARGGGGVEEHARRPTTSGGGVTTTATSTMSRTAYIQQIKEELAVSQSDPFPPPFPPPP